MWGVLAASLFSGNIGFNLLLAGAVVEAGAQKPCLAEMQLLLENQKVFEVLFWHEGSKIVEDILCLGRAEKRMEVAITVECAFEAASSFT